MIRKILDGVYSTLGRAAALCILAICAIIATQVVLNIIARIGGVGVAMSIPSYAEIAGYLLSAATFLALADAFVNSSHIRVNLVTDRLSPRAQWFSELAVLAIGSLFSWLMFFAALAKWREAIKFGDKSSGILAIPIAIPQFFMVLGLLVFAIAFVDIVIRTYKAGAPVLKSEGGE